jgi:RNA polymerase sigma factor (sigma-70 family)
VNQALQVMRVPIAGASHLLDLPTSVSQLSTSAQKAEDCQLCIVTQFSVKQAHLYIIALPPFKRSDLSGFETDCKASTENDLDQAQKFEQMLVQFLYPDIHSQKPEKKQLKRKVSVIDTFELNAKRYCIVQISPSNSQACEIPVSAADQSTGQTAYLQEESPEAVEELLSPREQEIVCLIAAGLSNKQIANRLDISIWTVSAHLRRIFTKLKVDTRAAVVYQCSKLIQAWKEAKL